MTTAVQKAQAELAKGQNIWRQKSVAAILAEYAELERQQIACQNAQIYGTMSDGHYTFKELYAKIDELQQAYIIVCNAGAQRYEQVLELRALVSDMANFLANLSIPVRRFLNKKQIDGLVERAEKERVKS